MIEPMKFFTKQTVMKKLNVLAFFFLMSSLLILAACDDQSEEGPAPEIPEEEMTATECAWLEDRLAAMDLDPLSETEIAGIAFMREEEKLARDVYLTLKLTWPLRVFDNISRSEQCHMDVMKSLIERYGLEDPAATTAPGEFADPGLQTLFHELIARGLESEVEALLVGAFIEETDILDIQSEVDQLEGNADVAMVYGNLLTGSTHHLRAFVRNLESRGVIYEPQFLDKAAYLDIINGGD